MIGQVLDHCRVLAKIGEGGMGVVYRAHEGKTWQKVLDGLPAIVCVRARSSRTLLPIQGKR